MDRRVWQATVHVVTELDMTERFGFSLHHLTNEKVPYCSFDLDFLNNSLFLSFKGLKKLCNGTIPLFKTTGVSPHFSSVKNRLILIFLSMRNEG